MKFVVDANLPKSSALLIQAAGHEAIHVKDLGWGSAPDEQIAAYAKANECVLLTRDFDFSDIRNYRPGEYHGIVVLDLPEHSTSVEINEVLTALLKRDDVSQVCPGRLAIVRLDRIRFRPRLT